MCIFHLCSYFLILHKAIKCFLKKMSELQRTQQIILTLLYWN
jgi:hypothetical protein